MLHVVRPSAGGMRAHVTWLVERLDPADYEVIVAGPDDEVLRERLERCGVGCRRLDMHPDFAPHRDVASVAALARVVADVRPDICHVHGFKAAALTRAALSLPLTWAGRRAPRHGPGVGGRPAIVYTVHNSVLARTAGSAQGVALRYLEQRFARATDRVVAVSRALWREYVSIPGLGPDKVRHIPNGVPLAQFDADPSTLPVARAAARAAFRCSRAGVVVGTASRLIPGKGVGTLLRAVAYLRSWGLEPGVLIAGDGPARASFERLSAGLGLGAQVRFLGFVRDMIGFYRCLDVFVLSSESEGMPVALIEAMASGIPVVAARSAGVEELVGPRMGRLVAPGDALALALGIRDAIARPHESATMAEHARASVRERHSIEEMVRATRSMYDEALEARRAVSPRWAR